MKFKHLLALGGATVIVLLSYATAFAAGAPKVTVTIEGKTHLLLAPTTVQTHTGSITKGGAPRGACPATSGAGALDVATHHRWSGSFDKGFGDYLIKSILGEVQSTTSYYWAIWIDNRFSSSGACGIKLHRGDRLLFAVDSVAHHEHPISLTVTGSPRRGHSFAAKVVWFSDAGVAKPLAGARVHGTGVSMITDAHGVAQITPSAAGTLVLNADQAGYIRAAPVRVHVSS